MGDELEDFLDVRGYYHEDFEKYHRFAVQLKCCIRAGFDVAVAPSAGVVGFDAGMLRRMWDGPPPEWVCRWFEAPLAPDTPDATPVWI